MRMLVRDPPPAEFAALLERRRRWGADRHDEVWNGVLHVNPGPHGRHGDVQLQALKLLDLPARAAGLTQLTESNVGDANDFRVPDGALHHPGPHRLYYPTAALVLEVVSPGDETWEKLDFYAAHGVGELLILDPQQRTVAWLALERGVEGEAGEYRPIERSRLLALSAAELAARIEWPSLEEEERSA